MLARVYELRNKISSPLKNKNINITVFHDAEWLSSLTCLVDLTSQLNKLNFQLNKIRSSFRDMRGQSWSVQ